MGTPGRVVRELGGAERERIRGWAEKYVEVARHYKTTLRGGEGGWEIGGDREG